MPGGAPSRLALPSSGPAAVFPARGHGDSAPSWWSQIGAWVGTRLEAWGPQMRGLRGSIPARPSSALSALPGCRSGGPLPDPNSLLAPWEFFARKSHDFYLGEGFFWLISTASLPPRSFESPMSVFRGFLRAALWDVKSCLSGDFELTGKWLTAPWVAAGLKLDSVFCALSFGCFSSRENSGHFSPRHLLYFLYIYFADTHDSGL